MNTYTIIIIISLIYGFLNTKYKFRNNITYFLLILLSFIVCFGYMTGSDWKTYELMYDDQAIDERMEVGYVLLNNTLSIIIKDFFVYLGLLKVAVFLIMCKLALRSKANIPIFVMLLLSFGGFYLFIDNPLRNFLAIGFCVLSCKYIVREDLIRYILCILIACSFHLSALIFIPAYWLSTIKIKSKWLFVIYITFFIVFSTQSFLLDFINSIFGSFSFFNEKFAEYIDSDLYGTGKSISFGNVFNIALLIVILRNRKQIVSSSIYGNLIFSFSYYYFLLYRFGASFSIFTRLQLYFVVFFSISLSVIFIKEYSTLYKRILLLIIGVYCVLIVNLTVTSSEKYIPYSNYILYTITNNKKPYLVRLNYNLQHSPYKSTYKGTSK